MIRSQGSLSPADASGLQFLGLSGGKEGPAVQPWPKPFWLQYLGTSLCLSCLTLGDKPSLEGIASLGALIKLSLDL